jgi:hypothetical protein
MRSANFEGGTLFALRHSLLAFQGCAAEILWTLPRPWHSSVETHRRAFSRKYATDAKGPKTKESFADSAPLREIELPKFRAAAECQTSSGLGPFGRHALKLHSLGRQG